jgi:hypothetical protein
LLLFLLLPWLLAASLKHRLRLLPRHRLQRLLLSKQPSRLNLLLRLPMLPNRLKLQLMLPRLLNKPLRMLPRLLNKLLQMLPRLLLTLLPRSNFSCSSKNGASAPFFIALKTCFNLTRPVCHLTDRA